MRRFLTNLVVEFGGHDPRFEAATGQKRKRPPGSSRRAPSRHSWLPLR
jgi:hypothetical protein